MAIFNFKSISLQLGVFYLGRLVRKLHIKDVATNCFVFPPLIVISKMLLASGQSVRISIGPLYHFITALSYVFVSQGVCAYPSVLLARGKEHPPEVVSVKLQTHL